MSNPTKAWRPRWLAAATALAAVSSLMLVAGPAPQAAAQEPSTTHRTLQAAAWLARELEANNYVLPNFTGEAGTKDFGLTIDALFVLAAAGVGGDIAEQVVQKVKDDGWEYTQWSDAHVQADMGSFAKVALALQLGGADPTHFDISQAPDWYEQWNGATEIDLVQLIRDSMLADGHFGIESNHFDQVLSILVLARTPQGVPAAGVDYLESLQCLDEGAANYGGLGYGVPGGTCGNVDGDATGFMLSGLLAAGRDAHDTSVQLALGWMEEHQKDDGAYAPAHDPALSNTNSTGLVANAARQVGTPGALAIADRAQTYLATQQVACGAPFNSDNDPAAGPGFARSWVGAIAYSQQGQDDAVASGIFGFQTDQWRRASAQAALGLGDLPGFSELTLDGIDPAAPALDDCTLSGGAPSIGGVPVVGETLTGVPGDLGGAFSPVSTATTWWRAETQVGTGTTYVVTAADVDHALRFRVTATAPGYEDAVLESLPITAKATIDTTISATGLEKASRYGTTKTVTVTVAGSAGGAVATGSVQARRGAKVVATSTLVAGKATVKVPASLIVGTTTLTFAYVPAPGAGFAPSMTVLTHRVVKARSRVAIRWVVKPGPRRAGVLRVAILQRDGSVTPNSGIVRVGIGKRVVSRNIKGDRIDLPVGMLRRGRYAVAVRYLGSGNFEASARLRTTHRVR